MIRRLTGLRARLAAAFLAVALLASVLASGISYVLYRRMVLERVQDAVLADVRQAIATEIPDQLPPDADHLLGERLEAVLTGRVGPLRVLAASETGAEGPVVVSEQAAGNGRRAAVLSVPPGGPVVLPAPGALHVPVDEEFARRALREMVYRRVVRNGTPYLLVGAYPIGYPAAASWRSRPPMVFLSVDLGREAADLRLFTRALLIADGAALAGALVLALLAARGVLRPVRRLGAAARALGDGGLDTRVDVRGRDELADLARTFNGTAEALERTVTELRVKDAASRRFVADVSHELRTPLTSMVALTDVLAEDVASGDGRAARLVAAETRRLNRLVGHLIEISRFDAGAAALVLDDVHVAEAVAATLDARGWTGEVDAAGPADLTARLDPRRFDVVLANLAGNALKHGRPPVTVRFGPAARDGRAGVEVTVTDRGPGLPDGLRDAIFDRFVKADAARTASDGSGLGLSIARENAALHGGTLTASDGAGGGAVFTLWLPAGQDEEAM
ncbi:HAMP domain-containing sensor histidine kinase [Actinomadura algeriensis]|uniref:histidine kinase n=1 Tax=Actinomadura algeriensis TaxID=1679523 RepID=A0ABR9JWY6_9ACTN|nr:HAMP domain-containing sensor histidine kinase [Actinomadura algeriensis]MBE1535091.1 two-component system sensor histidine kinase MtrB [Actinomadura algeriensis]